MSITSSRLSLVSLFAWLLSLLLLSTQFVHGSDDYPTYYVIFKNEHVGSGECVGPTLAVKNYLYVPYINELVNKTMFTDDDVVAIDPLLMTDPVYLSTHPNSRRKLSSLRKGNIVSAEKSRNEAIKQHRFLQSQCATFCSNPTYYAVQIRLRGCDCNRRRRLDGDDDDDDYSNRLYQSGNASYIAPGPAFQVATKFYTYVLHNVTTASNCRSKMYNATYEVWIYN